MSPPAFASLPKETTMIPTPVLSKRVTLEMSKIIFRSFSARRCEISHSILHHNDVRRDVVFNNIQLSLLSFDRGSKFFHGAYETIATSCQGLDVPAFLDRISECFAQLTDSGVQTIVEVSEAFRRPKPLTQGLSAYQLAAVFQELNEDLKGFFLQANFATVLLQFTGLQVSLKWTKTESTSILQ
jgi:hypothetical protein